MAFTVNDIYQWVYTLANQYESGQWTDENFNTALKVVNIELLRSELGLPESYKSGDPDPAISWQITNTISDDLRPFIVPVIINQNAQGYFPYPADYAGYSSIWYDLKQNPKNCGGQPSVKSIYVEPVSDDQLRVRLTSQICEPSLRYPIVVWYAGGFQVYPSQIKQIELTYVRYPATPVWGYTTLPNGQTQYDPTTSVQPEYPDTLLPNFAIRVCRYLSINLREDQFYAYISERMAKGE
jgi:hypothetical protein